MAYPVPEGAAAGVTVVYDGCNCEFREFPLSGWWLAPARFWQMLIRKSLFCGYFSGMGLPKCTDSSSNIYYSSFKEGT